MARLAGYELIPRNFYAPFPYDLPRSTWDRVSPLSGIEFDIDRQLEWLRMVTKNATGWTPPDARMYGPVDAEVLFGAIRTLKPDHVIELGSGISSEIIKEALGRNHDIYDPVPNDRTTLPVTRLSATEVPLEAFEKLRSGDVLFVDTTHTVKTGSDVNYVILDVLPSIASGVVVHFHDIFLPYEYPYSWAERGSYWAEQYLLQAFLSENDRWEVLCGCMAVATAFPDQLSSYVPRFEPGIKPGAFWMRRKG